MCRRKVSIRPTNIETPTIAAIDAVITNLSGSAIKILQTIIDA
jgi:hypothetical protein